MKYYQLMSGDSSRDFSQVMFDFGVAIVGPGNVCAITQFEEQYKEIGEWPKLRWLEEIEPGDRIVMHSGQSYIQGVGEVIEKDGNIYHYSNCFEDVDGWDLQHYCHVNWEKVELSFDGRPLSRSTAQRLHEGNVISKIEEQWDKIQFIIPKYEVDYPGDLDFNYDILEKELIDYGMRIEDAENTIRTLLNVEKLAKWYLAQGNSFPSSEHEIRAFIVIPILHALGWSYQKMSVEFDKLDIALFPNTKRDFPKILIETKSMWTGSVFGVNQVKGYMQSKSEMLSKLEKVIITDGITYWLYETKNMEKPMAYMSLRTKRMKNPSYPEAKGMIEFIKGLIP